VYRVWLCTHGTCPITSYVVPPWKFPDGMFNALPRYAKLAKPSLPSLCVSFWVSLRHPSTGHDPRSLQTVPCVTHSAVIKPVACLRSSATQKCNFALHDIQCSGYYDNSTWSVKMPAACHANGCRHVHWTSAGFNNPGTFSNVKRFVWKWIGTRKRLFSSFWLHRVGCLKRWIFLPRHISMHI